MTKFKYFGLVPIAIISSLGITACSNENSGSPNPIGHSSAAPVPTASNGGQVDWLGSVAACGLLTSQELAVMRVESSGKDQDTAASGATSGCHWDGTAANGAASALSVAVRAGQGIDAVDANGGQLSNGEVNHRPAAQVVDNPSATCMISLAVGPAARVDVTYLIIGATDATEACATDSQIADIVEPKLPEYEG
ncbi:DUF3558 domain-containing protein [Amycolatopsis acidicola]|uniref:DUF3558 domain-containing protein n=1 Tax=Amycolatopsis acidicola TaxID=2596893 RepID=A0A5N0VKW9_9PSEU|nr:DUF3558 family protein [Amycolatopsis acidicola]KAA9166865.1 DUF3558 domain-containing protein [Amycolatopsis acidicola]